MGLSASGGGFDGVASSLTYNVTDDEIPGLLTTVSAITVAEGSTFTIGVKLNAQPIGGVTVTVSTVNTNVATVSPTSLSFTTENWNTSQNVLVSAVDDQSLASPTTQLNYTARRRFFVRNTNNTYYS